MNHLNQNFENTNNEYSGTKNAASQPVRVGLIVVGDEILSGKRQDKHVSAIIERLSVRGMALSWVQIAGDDPAYLTNMLQGTFSRSQDVVLSCGGIGGTPDDHTRQSAARALGLPLVRHPEAEALIRGRCQQTGQEVNEYRLRMADFPEGSQLIPNPYNQIAGFFIRNHYFLPGFPVMAWPMAEWVLDTHCVSLHGSAAGHQRALLLFGLPEGKISGLMEQMELKYPACKLYSLPSVGGDGVEAHIELGIKAMGGDSIKFQVDAAFEELQNALQVLQGRFQVL